MVNPRTRLVTEPRLTVRCRERLDKAKNLKLSITGKLTPVARACSRGRLTSL